MSQMTASPSSPSSPSRTKTRGDRFIPERASIDFSVSQFALSRAGVEPSEKSPQVESYKRSLARAMFEPESVEVMAAARSPRQPVSASPQLTSPERKNSGPPASQPKPHDSISRTQRSVTSPYISSPKSPSKMLSFSPRTRNFDSPNPHKVLFANTHSPRRKTSIRIIPSLPERVLDAPGLIDDYYLNLLDWSAQNMVGVALGASVFTWNATTMKSHRLFTLVGSHSYVASLSFSGSGQYLAIGTHDDLVRIWDIEAGKMVRTLRGHSGRVCSLSWNESIVSSGSRDSMIMNHDVRMSNPLVMTFEGHNNEVCGIRWSPDGSQLASGSNDNLLNVWNISYNRPLFTLNQHIAAVKAISWCPWQRHLLASGGGTADKSIKFWNTTTGTCLNSIDTKSQVCSLQWSKHVKELVSSHGFSQNQLAIWKYPSMLKQAELTGHGNRVLHTAISPDGTTVVSAAADETLRFWKVFDVETSASGPRLARPSRDASARKDLLR